MAIDDNQFAFEEAFNLLCGTMLGEGCYRKVFACRVDPTLVVKVEAKTDSFANVGEYEFWESYCKEPCAKWLAPCVALSGYGRVLLQKRVEPLQKGQLPERVPSFLSDLKLSNFGMFEGRIVCCDYGLLTWSPAMRMRKANWD